MNPETLCLGCMEEQSECACGWRESTADDKWHLAPRTVIADHYLVGRVLADREPVTTYLGMDTALWLKVDIREYLPRGIAARVEGSPQVVPVEPEAYEMGFRGFVEEGRLAIRWQHPGFVRCRNVVRENGTCYQVMEHADGVLLEQYLDSAGGPMPWEGAMPLCLQLLDALHMIHTEGALMRDLHPGVLFLDGAGKLRLVSFPAPPGEMFGGGTPRDGYAPPELYSRTQRIGPWSDTYGAAATLYRMLTGSAPENAPDRLEKDTLEPPSRRGANVPHHVDQVVVTALALRGEQRYLSVREFRDALLGPVDKRGRTVP